MGYYLTTLSVSKDSRHRARAPLTSVPTGRVFLAPPRDRGKPLSYSLCKSSAMLWPHRKAQYKQKKTSNTLPVRQEQRDINPIALSPEPSLLLRDIKSLLWPRKRYCGLLAICSLNLWVETGIFKEFSGLLVSWQRYWLSSLLQLRRHLFYDHGCLFYDQYPLEYNEVMDVRPCCTTPVQRLVNIQHHLWGFYVHK